MIAIDFEYDGLSLSQFGYVIGSIDTTSGVVEATAGSELTFNLVSANRGSTSYHISSKYESYLETEIDIIKSNCESDSYIISQKEFRNLMRWLNRKDFHTLNFIGDIDLNGDDVGYEIIYYEASFNCSKLLLNGEIVGVKLKIQTNAPYGFAKEVDETYNLVVPSGGDSANFQFKDTSDEIGEIYPTIIITPSASGTLVIKNTTYDNEYAIIVKNCSSGETITIDNEHQIVTTDNNSHNVTDDFNYHWFRLVNTYNDRTNNISCSLPCSFEIKYKPIIKYGF